jgi:hypothetical protein
MRRAADTTAMSCLVSLEYPNGRTHELTLENPITLEPGYQFDLYGRRWIVVGRMGSVRTNRLREVRMLCRQITPL